MIHYLCFRSVNEELRQMIKGNDFGGVEDYLSNNPTYNLSAEDQKGNLPFDYTTSPKMADILLQFGVNPHQMSKRLNYFIWTNNKAMINWFLNKQDVDLDVIDDMGETPIFSAIRVNDAETVKLLLKKGASCR